MENKVLIDEDDIIGIEWFRFNCKKLMYFIGPGFLMSVAYIDPGNFTTDLFAGTTGGYENLWIRLWVTLLALYI